MALMPILRYPDPRLHKVATNVERIDDKIRKLIKDMADTMYAAPGVGLAATQLDVHKRIVVVDISETRDQLYVLINPEILEATGEADCEEGCLSVPGVYEKVRRAQCIKVQALDAEGSLRSLDAEGLLAVCIQHEMDHLEGRVFVEYLSRLKQSRILARFRKQERKAG